MNQQEKFNRAIQQLGRPVKPFFERPHLSRRQFFSLAGAGVTVAALPPALRAAEVMQCLPAATLNRARTCIFVLLSGAPSHVDTFDLKIVNGVTPVSEFRPETRNGILWPVGIMPGLAGQLDKLAIVRSVRAWALVHNLAQTWAQIGRNPAAALGDIAPHIGSIVAIEKEPERQSHQVFPTFIALNSNSASGSGYLPASVAPFKVTPQTRGLTNTTNPAGQTTLDRRLTQLHALDDGNRILSPYGRPMEDMNAFYGPARNMMYNQAVTDAFSFTAEESAGYGNSGFGNSCLIAKKVVAANQGTRFIQITLGGWDMHSDIYGTQNPNQPNIMSLSRQFDAGITPLLTDLEASGQLSSTLVVVMGEFGRTVGALSGAAGRDHYLQQAVLFAGAGVRGGRAIGSTDVTGARTQEFGWSRGRDVRAEDIEATIYSAMGINWQCSRYDDPFGRGFEYVPSWRQDIYGPITELWG